MLDLDRIQFEVACPRCRFTNRIFYRNARLRDVVICRGCNRGIRLDDHMNECRKARTQFNNALRELEKAISGLNITIKL